MKPSLFHMALVARSAALTPESGAKRRPFVQVGEKANVWHTSEVVVTAAFAYGESTSPAISQADTSC